MKPMLALLTVLISACAAPGQGQGLAAHGAVVIAIDAPFARRGAEPIRFIARDRDEQVRLIKDLQRAVLDDLAPMADAQALHAAAPAPRTIRWYDVGHSPNAQALIDRHEFLNARIGPDLLEPWS